MIDQLLRTYPIVSDQVDAKELRFVLEQLEKALVVEGAVVEFGCYIGTTSLFIRRLLDGYKDQRPFHVYDSFEGLPEKAQQDLSPAGEQFKAGELSVSKKRFLQEFTKAHLVPPVIHKGWFSDVAPVDVPAPIAFAFLDGDYYDSIKDSFKAIESKLTKGAIIVVDDYANEALPGAARAVDEWCASHGYTAQTAHSLAIIRCN
jgi:O-methyltransferase